MVEERGLASLRGRLKMTEVGVGDPSSCSHWILQAALTVSPGDKWMPREIQWLAQGHRTFKWKVSIGRGFTMETWQTLCGSRVKKNDKIKEGETQRAGAPCHEEASSWALLPCNMRERWSFLEGEWAPSPPPLPNTGFRAEVSPRSLITLWSLDSPPTVPTPGSHSLFSLKKIQAKKFHT